MTIKPKLTPAAPTHVWRCETCQAEALGPEWPGYSPHCPICGLPLGRTPMVPEQK